MRIEVCSFSHSLRTELALGERAEASADPASLTMYWLGQAGFVVRLPGGYTLVIDPYLSDSLAHKYRGRMFEHVRMMPAPIDPTELGRVDAVLCTHHHSDHMDPGTLPQIAASNPHCRFIVPEPAIQLAVKIGLPATQLTAATPGRPLRLGRVATVETLPSAHEALDVLPNGASRYLGYVIETGGVHVYHSGDCVPYERQAERLAALRTDVALLPVNGRDANRSANGVTGNFTFDEAVDLCSMAHVPFLIPHHIGMFAFNTVAPETLGVARAHARGVTVVLPTVGAKYEIRKR